MIKGLSDCVGPVNIVPSYSQMIDTEGGGIMYYCYYLPGRYDEVVDTDLYCWRERERVMYSHFLTWL